MADVKQEDGGPAFPRTDGGYSTSQEGMSLRDYFAAKALAGLIASYSGPDVGFPPDDYAAKKAYCLADAMLEARAALKKAGVE